MVRLKTVDNKTCYRCGGEFDRRIMETMFTGRGGIKYLCPECMRKTENAANGYIRERSEQRRAITYEKRRLSEDK